jgi:hypothetical protein
MSKLNKIGDFCVDDTTYIEYLKKINTELLEACEALIVILKAIKPDIKTNYHNADIAGIINKAQSAINKAGG